MALRFSGRLNVIQVIPSLSVSTRTQVYSFFLGIGGSPKTFKVESELFLHGPIERRCRGGKCDRNNRAAHEYNFFSPLAMNGGRFSSLAMFKRNSFSSA